MRYQQSSREGGRVWGIYPDWDEVGKAPKLLPRQHGTVCWKMPYGEAEWN
jgi:hypothetical protein